MKNKQNIANKIIFRIFSVNFINERLFSDEFLILPFIKIPGVMNNCKFSKIRENNNTGIPDIEKLLNPN